MIVVYFLQGNHGSGSHPNEDINVRKKHRVSDHLYTILLSMVRMQNEIYISKSNKIKPS